MIDADRLEALLAERGMNPFSAAKAAGLGADYVRDILRGKVKQPSGYKLARLAKALDCSTDYLLGLSADKGAAPKRERHHPQVSHLPIVHRLAARVFRPPEDENEVASDLAVLTFELSEYADRAQWIGVVQDDHALPFIAKGHAVHVVDIEQHGDVPSMGDVVVIERFTSDRALVERSIQKVVLALPEKQFAIRPIHSRAESDDELTFIKAPLMRDDSGLIHVVGRILYSYRPWDRMLRLSGSGPNPDSWPE